MPYVNFKEEKVKANIQIDKRKRNNENLYTYILKHKDSLSGYIPSEKYSYNNFKDKIIGKKGVLGEEDFAVIKNEDIVCSKFINCNFKNIKFKDCRFVACVFENCNFDGGGAVFENCILIKEDSDKLPSLNRKDNLGCSFYNCNIYAKFLNSDISHTIFEKCKLQNTHFIQSVTTSVIINKCELNKITMEDCDFSGGKIISSYIADLDFTDKDKTKFDEKTFFDKIQPRIKDKQEYEGIYMTYETIADKFKENSLTNNFGEYYYLAKSIERKCIKTIPKLQSYIYWLTCGYGERPEFALISSLVMIFIFGLIYLFTGIDIEGEVVRYTFSNISQISFSQFISHLNEVINLSVGMFGGVGTNVAIPIETSYVIANIEMLSGVVMMGVAIGTLVRKIIR